MAHDIGCAFLIHSHPFSSILIMSLFVSFACHGMLLKALQVSQKHVNVSNLLDLVRLMLFVCVYLSVFTMEG